MYAGPAGFRRRFFRKDRRQDSGFCDSFDEHYNSSDNDNVQDVIIINCNKPDHQPTSVFVPSPTHCRSLGHWKSVQRTPTPSVGEKLAFPLSSPSLAGESDVPPPPPPRPQKRDDDDRPAVPPRRPLPPLQQRDGAEKTETTVTGSDASSCNPAAIETIALVSGPVESPPTPPPRPAHTLRH
jgi:hypothetical protein